MPKIKRILDGKEYEIELTPAEIAAVCEYSEHEAAEAVIKETLKHRANEALKDDKLDLCYEIINILLDHKTLSEMTDDYLERKSLCSTDKTILNTIIEKYTEV